MNAHPLSFGSDAGTCVGWFHAGSVPRRHVCVVMCRPMGYEAMCSYRTYTQLAETLSAAGFDVLRFDYHGCGDSPGDDTDPDRVDAWRASIRAAIAKARELTGSDHVARFGMRYGATLAVQAAIDDGAIDTLMLWAPCPSGRSFVREMRAAEAGRTLVSNAPGLEALGTWFTPETLAAMQSLDATKVPSSPARDILIIGRDDMPGEGPVPAHFRSLGADVTFTVWPGYAGLMAEPHEAVLTPETLESITQWLRTRHARVHSNEVRLWNLPPVEPVAAGPVIETPLRFGNDLFGILAEPAIGTATPRGDSVVLMLNVGGNYRIGPNRNYAKASRELAAAGYRALRFDVSGIGDSRTEKGFDSGCMYRDWATADVSAAMDMLAERGCRKFFLMGICSGSYLAFQTALTDPRVTGVMLMNSRLLEWDVKKSGPWQSSMQQYYKSTRYYRRALLRSDVYTRLLRGEIDVRGIAGRMWDLLHARMKRGWDRYVRGAPPQEGVLRKFRHLAKNGCETLLVMSEDDDGLDYMQFHLGVGARRMRGHKHFRMAMIPDADHTFSTVSCQRALIETLREHLHSLHAEEVAAAALPDPPVPVRLRGSH